MKRDSKGDWARGSRMRGSLSITAETEDSGLSPMLVSPNRHEEGEGEETSWFIKAINAVLVKSQYYKSLAETSSNTSIL